jgi:hypothetical protein
LSIDSGRAKREPGALRRIGEAFFLGARLEAAEAGLFDRSLSGVDMGVDASGGQARGAIPELAE